MAATESKVLGRLLGDEAFPVEWAEGEADLFWVRDDLHCPNPLSPLYFDLGGWWLTCDHMFRRFATECASIVERADTLEAAIDMHDRHWKIHWMLNSTQFSATIGLNATIAEIKGEVNPNLPGRLQSSVEDSNWDSIEALWQMKEEVKGDDELRAAFDTATAADTIAALGG